ncbi:PREDICTED: uncharacterized protein LOC109147108 [Ipomoea nil]|uniref:uncharacterized protein LOC109147108 n=1 Tax=Ipomoea nil TaxID=35883 RepID=UPI000900B96B|nr:PREDICTED: uncharacterized protein LOC109147108 [Ipomoea nil]
MKLPPGFVSSCPNKVCRLRKSLYGLRQAPRCWFPKLADSLTNYGFHQSSSDHSLFTCNHNGVKLYILIYVDDLVISGNGDTAVHRFKLYLSNCFHMKDFGTLKYFLGLEVARNESGIFLSQRKYAFDILEETGLLGAKPAAVPLEENHRLALANGKEMTDPTSYRKLVGRLIYMTVTRPDICYSVHILAQFMHKPQVPHWEAALRVVRYLKANPGQGLFFGLIVIYVYMPIVMLTGLVALSLVAH